MFTRRTLLSHGLALLGGVRFLRDLTKAIFDPPMIYTFQEEFDGPAGSAPDPSKWRYDLGRWADNDELETYTDSRANSYLDGNGNLVIKAIKVTERGGRSRRVTYTSARLQTQDTFSQTYGTWEARIKVDLATGTWPAWWAIGESYSAVGWPRCGEIDMVEVYGQRGWPADSTVHVASTSDGDDISKVTSIPGGVDTDWHVYRLVWDASSMKFYFDPAQNPVPYQTVTPTDLPSWPFGSENPQFMILNLAVGGRGGGRVPASFKSATLLVDYIRVSR